ncbi:MAG: bifunctional lysylphosphatidylglycerol flippase/synthetase MprF [Hydrogenophaga sp.]|uniref:bifunctional lysylphosphatidylglycerol flippase/synthetase MprF n=1 Tax=Hydrogenophaga sp. TaxID=1904254 RepID=UPI001E100801|nr:bifunctional lysylphosphatidylglycerol flippase/synthetase MprF [Hydrogenophaga sp.]MBX3608742.1 bifunctional lysylphosphatidylglycerol flippase/synthetase MprF [Hydrogenophaga sp.]
MSPVTPPSLPARWAGLPWRWIASAASLLLLALALAWLHRALAGAHLRDVVQQLRALPPLSLGLALTATACSYAALVAYDLIALRVMRRAVPWPHAAATAFMATALGHNVGLSVLSGGAVRLRLYGAWGLNPGEVATLSGLVGLSFGLGVTLCVGLALWLEPASTLRAVHLAPAWGHVAGALLCAVPLGVLARVAFGAPTLSLRDWQLPLPSLPQATMQLGLSLIDLASASLVLWCLLPDGAIAWLPFLGIYLLAMVAGIVSHVPGGIGVFEAVLIAALPQVPAHHLLAASLAYRAVYYLLPLGLAALLALGLVLRAHATRARQWLAYTQPVAAWLAPWLSATLAFAAGAVLLLSGSLPADSSRLHALREVVPLAAIEFSHLAGSLIGLALLILSRALLQRVDAARRLAMVLLLAGALASLTKGLDVPEAVIAVLAAGVLAAGKAGFRRQSRWHLANDLQAMGPQVWLGVGAVVVASVWLGLFSFRHVEYANDLWWQFALRADAPRYLRASLLVAVACLGLLTWQAVRPRGAAPQQVDGGQLRLAQTLVAQCPRTDAALALLGDKRLLFDDHQQAMLMYQVQGRSWIAMGDPVGEAEAGEALAWRLREMADRHGGRAVFYQVSADRLPLYLDMGLSAIKLGEEAVVPLSGFSLEGPRRAHLRQALRRAEREGLQFEVIAPGEVEAHMAQLREVSDHWLQGKATREKGFSLGRFDADYLRHFPIALVRKEGRIVAFANLWPGNGHDELSIDLMRHDPQAVGGVMDVLFTQVMLWGAAKGYQSFSLGMAPLSGLESHPLAPLWHRLGTTLYRSGEHFYNFQGLRAYKQKFDPEWQPRYLACPGGLALPGVLLDVASLIAGGWRGVLAR